MNTMTKTVFGVFLCALTLGFETEVTAAAFNPLYRGAPCVKVKVMSSDAAVVRAADEYVAFVNALLRRTDYTGAGGHYTLQLALAGDGSCNRADELMAANDQDRTKLGDEGFLLAEGDARTFMLCAYSGKGVLNGVYRILEKTFGVVAPRPSVELDFPDRIDVCKDLPLPFADRPAFRRRGLSVCCQKQHQPDIPTWTWMARAGLNARSMSVDTYHKTGWAKEPFGFVDALGGHSFMAWLPKREFYETHPEYYSLIDGKRVAAEHGAQISLGNPEVIDVLVERMLAYKAKHPELTMLPFGYNDSGSNPKNQFGWSEDPLDLALDSPNDFPKEGSQRPRTFSTRYIKAANRIIERLNKVYPDLKLMVYAYHFIMLQPPDCEIHPNLVAEFAPLYKCCQHPMNDPNCPRNRLFNEFLVKWAAKTPNLYVRDYFSVSAWHFPLISLHNVFSEMRYYRELGLAGIQPETFADGPNGGNVQGCDQAGRALEDDAYVRFWDANALVHFALARLAWDPDQSMEAIVNLYCRSYYGQKVGPLMAKYFLLAEENVYSSSHPGEATEDLEKGDWINRGKWCLGWNWRPSVVNWSRRLFAVDSGKTIAETAQPLMDALVAAVHCARQTGDRRIINRVSVDFENLKVYLLAQGCEIDALSLRPGSLPRLSVVRNVAVEKD